MLKIKNLIFTGCLLFNFSSHAHFPFHESTQAETEYAQNINAELYKEQKFSQPEKFEQLQNSAHQPIEDDALFSYVLLSAEDYSNTEIQNLRKIIASNLPKNAKLVVLTTTNNVSSVRRLYSSWIEESRLIIASDSSFNNRNGFWARDSFPIPVKNPESNEVSLIAHQYYRPFSSFAAIANSVSANFIERDEIFVGGNLLADKKGNCFVVNSRRMYGMKPATVKDVYGCKTMHALNHETGIGDVDEVIKPLRNNIMLTNQTNYVPLLESLGYKIVMLPHLEGTYRTYVNSLIVENVVFMPSYDVPEDTLAQSIYESLGYKVVPIRSNALSDWLHGSIHCQTMAYPAIEKNKLFDALGLIPIS